MTSAAPTYFPDHGYRYSFVCSERTRQLVTEMTTAMENDIRNERQSFARAAALIPDRVAAQHAGLGPSEITTRERLVRRLEQTHSLFVSVGGVICDVSNVVSPSTPDLDPLPPIAMPAPAIYLHFGRHRELDLSDEADAPGTWIEGAYVALAADAGTGLGPCFAITAVAADRDYVAVGALDLGGMLLRRSRIARIPLPIDGAIGDDALANLADGDPLLLGARFPAIVSVVKQGLRLVPSCVESGRSDGPGATPVLRMPAH